MTSMGRYFRVVAGLLAVLSAICACARPRAEIRPAAVAGQFYPSDPKKLTLAIQEFMKDAVAVKTEKPVAIIVPHAGYIYSGQICADAYRQASGNGYDLVVILGTNHTAPDFGKISVFSKGVYQTPLGNAPVDEAVALEILAQDKNCTSDTNVQEREHSVEVQVPFVQVVFPSAKILPVVIGKPDPAMCADFGRALGKVLRNRKALIVASSDLSHYPAYLDARRTDHATLKGLVKLDSREFTSTTASFLSGSIPNLVTCACGEGPILAAMAAAKSLGATSGVVVSYANSGDTSIGDLERVVGYGAAVLTTGKAGAEALDLLPAAPAESPLQAADKKTLLNLARTTLRRYFATDTVPLIRNVSPRLMTHQGVFVTLRERGDLRGCIGHIPPDYPLGRAVSAMTMQAAFNDTRFRPLQRSELDDLEIEISVLTPLKPVARAQDIVVGRDGVVISKNGRGAVFLPQVATEQKWGLDQMLENLCRKAGLPADGWKQGAKFTVFQAVVFDESQYR